MYLSKLRVFTVFITFGIGVIITSAIVISTRIPKVEVINDEIEIKYEESVIEEKSRIGIFSITNNTNETVYYFGDDKTSIQDSLVNQNGSVKFSETRKDVEITEYELKSNESTYFRVPLPQNERPFEASFILRVGEKRKEQVVVVEVQKQNICK